MSINRSTECFSEFIRENAIEITNKHAPKWETDLPRVQDFILSTSYGMLPLLTYKFPTDREIKSEDIEDFYKHQKMAFVAARGFNVAYELIGNLRKADWYNQVKKKKKKERIRETVLSCFEGEHT